MKKFTVPCEFGEEKAPFDVYIGNYSCRDYHPLHFQHFWLDSERGGVIPEVVMESFQKLYDLAKKDKDDVSFEELSVYALNAADKADGEKEEKNDTSKSSEELGKPEPEKKWIKYHDGSVPSSKEQEELTDYFINLIFSKNDDINIEASKLFAAYFYRQFPFAYLLETMLFEIYTTIMNDDPHYSICVILDTQGSRIHPDGFKYFHDFIHKKPKERMEIFQVLNEAIIDWVYKKTEISGSATREVHKKLLSFFPPIDIVNSAKSPEELGILAENLYYGNDGFEKDFFWAFRCSKQSAEKGYTHSQRVLGYMYYVGEGCPVDHKEGTYWSKIAADNGDSQAQVNLGDAYEYGCGVEQDIEKALFWYKKAAEQSHQFAIEKVEALEKKEASAGNA